MARLASRTRGTFPRCRGVLLKGMRSTRGTWRRLERWTRRCSHATERIPDDAARRHVLHDGAIFIEINKLLESEAYSDELFEEVGKRWGLGKTATKEIYYAERSHLLDEHPQLAEKLKSSREMAKKSAVTKNESHKAFRRDALDALIARGNSLRSHDDAK